MPVSSIKLVEAGSKISFRSKNASDPTIWQGTLELVGTYRSIRPYGDPSSYNQAVRQTDNNVSSDVTDLTYFLITIDNQADSPTMQFFADEWIQPGSLNVLNLGNKVTIVVDDPLNNSQVILSLLASAGYATKIIPNQ